ncbi:MAG: hypothetical protein IJS54_04230 [Desulfovibrio sp.]|nr:hypothetical protein [Desulfovibrio sp.]
MEQSTYPWARFEPVPLIGDVTPACSKELAEFLAVLGEIRPLSKAHAEALPGAINALSRILTEARAEMTKPYWSNQDFVSAYLYYFLPWNLVRLTRFFAGLCPETPAKGSWIVDIGTGPGTVPLALWFAKPAWRTIPLTLCLQDSQRSVLPLAKRLCERVFCRGNSPWKVVIAKEPVASLSRRLLGESLALVTCANVINEWVSRRSLGEWDFSARINAFLEQLSPLLVHKQAPWCVCIEPGTRLGGTTIMALRKEALAAGFQIVAPCTHANPCPLLAKERRTWCHCTFDTTGSPAWLNALSEQAQLQKEALSLAPLVFTKKAPKQSKGEIRCISSSFVVPSLSGKARYACAEKGLLLLEDAEGLPQYARLRLEETSLTGLVRDTKSGAICVRSPKEHGQKKARKR